MRKRIETKLLGIVVDHAEHLSHDVADPRDGNEILVHTVFTPCVRGISHNVGDDRA
jgi:hypothetical protein